MQLLRLIFGATLFLFIQLFQHIRKHHAARSDNVSTPSLTGHFLSVMTATFFRLSPDPSDVA